MMQDDGLGEWETCSWCTTEVRWVTLYPTDEGNLCSDCTGEYLAAKYDAARFRRAAYKFVFG